MAVLLEDIVKSVEQLLKLISKKSQEQPYVDPTLDPVLLVPGIAGSILNAVDDKTGKTERVWVRILGADHEFRDKVWSRFDPATGKTVNLDADTHIEVPQDRYGLYAIDTLDPDMVLGSDCVYYFHDMIVELIKWGYQEGTTLFGFGYDFRQSNRFQETIDRLASKLESVYTASGGRKITIISHSMGGLLTKCFMSLHSDIFEKYVKTWIAIAAPFRGAPGYISSSFLNGVSFVEGWEQNFFISKWSMQQLLLECPSIYELMACLDFKWEHIPLLEIWREKCDSDGNATITLESYPPAETIAIFREALSTNKVSYDGADISVPFNVDILKWANETRKLLSSAKVPNQIKFYNIYGTSYKTPHSVCYGSEHAPISDLRKLPTLEAKYIYVDGDGTVPMESAKADGLRAEARVGVPGGHRGILCDRHVFRILKHWLKADHDPFYNPVNDYVILPSAFDMESLKTKGLQVTSLKEEWEIIGEDEKESEENMTERKPLVGSVSVARRGGGSVGDKSVQEEAHATVIVHPQNDGKKHVELNAVSISASA
ncbi:Lecithin:cholesterol acyltransferase (LCAT)/Acyl-ceramide synthase [Handroanthus impetiginosus]|uniref:Lecithin:cholesterol acyltransferase (LCAT)/Acyl-ceramide synthase n=1 Tax=Handroanthus impetiginosus TaxID=429701 RepID=A0A2G9I4W4_9LAMI|nr:Lecithin:cholesterol acyltransferase (LCAT)/Acyl-ceramide synthase [Handroanthus impetiginosus]